MKIQVLALALFGALFSFSASAANSRLAAQSIGGGYRIIPGSTGAPLITNTAVRAGAVSGEALIVDMFKGPIPAGKGLDLVANRALPWSTLARTVGRFSPYIVAGSVLYGVWDYMRVAPAGTGYIHDPGQVQENIDGYFCLAGGFSGYASTPSAACSAGVAKMKSRVIPDEQCSISQRYEAQGSATPLSLDVYQVSSYIQHTAQSCPATRRVFITTVTAQPQKIQLCPEINGFRPAPGFDGRCETRKYEPITNDEAAQLFERHADKEKAPAIVEEMLEKDVKFEPAPEIKLQGETKVESAPRVKTETSPDGKTTTTTVKDVYNITYQGNTYTWNIKNIVEKSDGSKSEEDKPSEPEREEVSPPQDPMMPERPKLYEQKYPDGIAGVWDKEMAGVSNTPIFQFLRSMNPGLGGSDCPKWAFPAGDFMGLKFAGGDISAPCSVWLALKAIIIVSALLLARRLIFGG